MKGRQQGQEALSVGPIRLGASASAIDKDACRLDDMVAHAVSDQQPMQPEAVAPRFEAGDDLYFASERSEEHTSELQSLMRISYAVFCLKNKQNTCQNLTLVHRHFTTTKNTTK